MKIRQILRGGKLHIEHEAATPKDAFKSLARAEEVFGHEMCGACKGTDLAFVTRKVEKYEYFEMRCKKCSATLSFGQHQDGEGSLFPRRKDPDSGEWLPNGGWVKYQPPTEGGKAKK